MPEVEMKVDAGVCRFKTVIIANMDENMDITYKIKSECPAVRNMGKALEPLPVFDIIAMPHTENVVYKKCSVLEHAACPVPCAMIKAAEVAGELALKREVSFTFSE